MKPSLIYWKIAVGQVALLALLGWHFRHALNTDAVAYLRIASYYAEGNTSLAVTGYWSPLLSWLMAGFLKLGMPELAAARVAMSVSALVFLWGCVAVFRAFQLPRRWCVMGAMLAALTGAYWSAVEITPDLLMAGLVALAVSLMCDDRRPGTGSDSLIGVLWGWAYLAKAVALPLGVLAIFVFGGLDFVRRRSERGLVLRRLLVQGAIFLAVALPWVVRLSLKYQQLTFSTTARISHAITGPPDVDRYHPFARTFHQPEPDRITSWEEPSLMAYRDWSPFENAAYMRHQIKVIGRNVVTIAVLMMSVSLGWWMIVVLLAQSLIQKQPGTRGINSALLWLRVLVIPLSLVVVYLPFSVLVSQQRFFYGAFPFFFAGLVMWAELPTTRKYAAKLKEIFVVLSTCLPLLVAVLYVGDSTRLAGECAFDLANRIQAAKVAGPIAGSGSLTGGRAGLYVSFLLKQPWLGDEQNPSPASLKNSGARLVVMRRNSLLTRALDADAGFINLDKQLFTDDAKSQEFPLQVYEVRERNKSE